MSGVLVYRIVKAVYASAAYGGDGARLTNGRWHTRGTAVVYCSSSLALAALETLVHLQPLRVLPAYVVVPALIPRNCILGVETLHGPWERAPEKSLTREVGDAWVASGASLALKAPSVVVPSERNYLVNPHHKDFHRIIIRPSFPFRFDKRLFA